MIPPDDAEPSYEIINGLQFANTFSEKACQAEKLHKIMGCDVG
jgi:hypothetical protein